MGVGGGQVLRSALGLSLVTGKPFTIHNIRGKRSKPGLLRQHLTAVEAATQICDGATISSDVKVGSTALTFKPGTLVSRSGG
jgi:RNA 3'-terminal phosphate cyclase (ATP)